MNTEKLSPLRVIVVFAIAFAVLLANVLAITPQLHQRLHGASSHECAVTLIAAGKYDHPTTAASWVVPDRLRCETIFFSRDLPIAVAAMEFSLLEHAPPRLS